MPTRCSRSPVGPAPSTGQPSTTEPRSTQHQVASTDCSASTLSTWPKWWPFKPLRPPLTAFTSTSLTPRDPFGCGWAGHRQPHLRHPPRAVCSRSRRSAPRMPQQWPPRSRRPSTLTLRSRPLWSLTWSRSPPRPMVNGPRHTAGHQATVSRCSSLVGMRR